MEDKYIVLLRYTTKTVSSPCHNGKHQRKIKILANRSLLTLTKCYKKRYVKIKT